MELMPNDEAVWTYFDAQHKYILEQMQDTYNAAKTGIKSMCCFQPQSTAYTNDNDDSPPREELSRNQLPRLIAYHSINAVEDLCGCVGLETTRHDHWWVHSIDRLFVLCMTRNHVAQAGGHDVWQAIMAMVKNVSEVMLSSLPNFWKISRAFLDGKFKVSNPDYYQVC